MAVDIDQMTQRITKDVKVHSAHRDICDALDMLDISEHKREAIIRLTGRLAAMAYMVGMEVAIERCEAEGHDK